ncbi:MAG: four helix bundle protein [Anaerolineae bacterium]
MATALEDLRVLQAAETVADGIWRRVVRWDPFAREVVGGQLARAADSIGANIAEAFGRFHYGEKLQFLYYARGSVYETKYWLNRALARDLMPSGQVQGYVSKLTDLARQLNAFAGSLKAQRRGTLKPETKIREESQKYLPELARREQTLPLFTAEELEWLETVVEVRD